MGACCHVEWSGWAHRTVHTRRRWLFTTWRGCARCGCSATSGVEHGECCGQPGAPRWPPRWWGGRGHRAPLEVLRSTARSRAGTTAPRLATSTAPRPFPPPCLRSEDMAAARHLGVCLQSRRAHEQNKKRLRLANGWAPPDANCGRTQHLRGAMLSPCWRYLAKPKDELTKVSTLSTGAATSEGRMGQRLGPSSGAADRRPGSQGNKASTRCGFRLGPPRASQWRHTQQDRPAPPPSLQCRLSGRHSVGESFSKPMNEAPYLAAPSVVRAKLPTQAKPSTEAE